jgi:hypothetical protein
MDDLEDEGPRILPQGFYLEAICDLGVESSLLGKTSKLMSGFRKGPP